MSVEMKLGRWEARDGSVHVVDRFDPEGGSWPWEDTAANQSWARNGRWHENLGKMPLDLIRYLGPLEPSPTPACAEAGPAGASTVSTEDPQESLMRMRDRYNAMDREASIYSGLLAALDQAKSDLDEAIKKLEKEHDL